MKKISGKKVIAFILSLVLLGLLNVPCALSDSVVAEGETGGTRWVLTDSGELTISGSGPMKEPHDWDPKTWAAYNGRVRKVTIEKGVTTIAPKAFAGCAYSGRDHQSREFRFFRLPSVKIHLASGGREGNRELRFRQLLCADFRRHPRER